MSVILFKKCISIFYMACIVLKVNELNFFLKLRFSKFKLIVTLSKKSRSALKNASYIKTTFYLITLEPFSFICLKLPFKCLKIKLLFSLSLKITEQQFILEIIQIQIKAIH